MKTYFEKLEGKANVWMSYWFTGNASYMPHLYQDVLLLLFWQVDATVKSCVTHLSQKRCVTWRCLILSQSIHWSIWVIQLSRVSEHLPGNDSEWSWDLQLAKFICCVTEGNPSPQQKMLPYSKSNCPPTQNDLFWQTAGFVGEGKSLSNHLLPDFYFIFFKWR